VLRGLDPLWTKITNTNSRKVAPVETQGKKKEKRRQRAMDRIQLVRLGKNGPQGELKTKPLVEVGGEVA